MTDIALKCSLFLEEILAMNETLRQFFIDLRCKIIFMILTLKFKLLFKSILC
jgi:hypothetical protein